MKTYEIISLENGKVLQTIEASGLLVDQQGIVTFYEQEHEYTTRTNMAATQVSSSTIIVEKKSRKPALVVEFKEEQCTNQS